MINIEDLQIRSYIIERGDGVEMATLDRVPQADGKDKWAIRQGGMCLSVDGDWEYEPMPSSRDDEFLQRCRFETPFHALSAWEKKKTNRFKHYKREA